VINQPPQDRRRLLSERLEPDYQLLVREMVDGPIRLQLRKARWYMPSIYPA